MWPSHTIRLAMLGVGLTSSGLVAAADPKYIANSMTAIRALESAYYDSGTGLWGDAWWNSGVTLTTLAEFAILYPDEAGQLGIPGTIDNTFKRAQEALIKVDKRMEAGGKITTRHCGVGDLGCWSKREMLGERRFKDFLNEFYDDEGWWALGLIRSYDATGKQEYLDAAVTIYEDMRTGLGGPCNGGIYWTKDREYVNAIANELYLTVIASLANRIDGGDYLETAKDQWRWFKESGMINGDSLVNDGLNTDCSNNGDQTWTYNQGVILGGLVELYKAGGSQDGSLLDEAHKIAEAALEKLSDDDGILREAGNCEENEDRCGADGGQFKGIFVRHLSYLQRESAREAYKEFILRNADSIWEEDRNGGDDKLGVAWYGPYHDALASHHSSALDAIVAAVAVS